jgi:hypothetical protein
MSVLERREDSSRAEVVHQLFFGGSQFGLGALFVKERGQRPSAVQRRPIVNLVGEVGIDAGGATTKRRSRHEASYCNCGRYEVRDRGVNPSG